MSEQDQPSLVARLLRATAAVEDAILVLLLAAMILLAGAQIVLRNLAGGGFLWADSLLRVLVLWVGLLGAVAATRSDKQITVDALSRLLPPRGRAAARVVTDLFTTAVSLFLGFHSARLVLDERAAGTIAFASVPTWVCELVLPVAFTVIGVRYLLLAITHLREAATKEVEA